MQPRKPIYENLLTYLSQDLLDQFISQLTTAVSQRTLPVTYLTEVDQPVYCHNQYYYSAICYAASLDDLLMVKSLLSIGANPNISDLDTIDGSALLIASRSKKPNASQILRRLLAEPHIERYVINGLGHSIFLHAKGDSSFILKLLEFDPLVSMFAQDEKQEISDKIAAATESNSAFETNKVICQTLNDVYSNATKLLESKINAAIPDSTSGQPLTEIVLSYLFRPQQQPHSLKVMENWVLHNEKQPEAHEETNKCRIS